MQEIWKDIKDYEGLYQVSNLGRVKRIFFTNGKYSFKKERILKPVPTKDYYHITLSKNNKKCVKLIHVLVANAFVSIVNGKNYVNHKDGNKLNNNANNLEWCTLSENTQHAFKRGLMKEYKNKYKQMMKPIAQIDPYTKEIIKTFNGIREAERETGIHNANILKSCKMQNRNAGGYKWQYISTQ